MKKYLMTAVAALALGGLMTSCTKDTDLYGDSAQKSQDIQKTYEEAFLSTFGRPVEGLNWGFGPDATASTKAMTRTITVNGDVYEQFTFPTSEELTAAFPTGVPTNAKTDAELEALYVGQTVKNADGTEYKPYGWPVTMSDMYAVYLNVVGKTEMDIKVTTPGEYSVGHTYANPADQVYNVYINIGAGNNLTLKRNGAEHVNFYILSGNITIDSSFGECGGIISVASGATVNDKRDHIAHNDGIRVYNRGTYNATNTTSKTEWLVDKNVTYCYAIGNNVKFYNEATFTATGALAYNSGAGNTAWFYNIGDGVRLTAPSMTLNSTCNFYSDGIVNISDETFVTKDGIVWINNGHYYTGSLTFSAKNTSFYNYCQLIVEGNAHMYDGEFNLMSNSYAEAGTAEMDNFICNMGSNTGMYIKGNVRMIAQGDGTYQGFRTSGSNDYLLIDGTVTVDAHYHTFSISSGITYSINNIAIVRDGNTITEEWLKEKNDGAYPVLDFNGTNCPYGQLSVSTSTNSCGATWDPGTTPPGPGPDLDPDPDVVMVVAEDLSTFVNSEGKDMADFDFNDVVFEVRKGASAINIKLRAAGGTLPLTIGGTAGETVDNHGEQVLAYEVHRLFKVSTGTMVNTNATSSGASREDVEFSIPYPEGVSAASNIYEVANAIPIRVYREDVSTNGKGWIEIQKAQPVTSSSGNTITASKLCVDTNYDWCDERDHIDTQFPYIDSYGNNKGSRFRMYLSGTLRGKWWQSAQQ